MPVFLLAAFIVTVEAVRDGPLWAEVTRAAMPVDLAAATSVAAVPLDSAVVVTAVGVFREAESSGAAASVDEHSLASTVARESSSSRTRTIPITVTARTIPATRTPRTATRIHPTMPLNTATGTVRRTAAQKEAYDVRREGGPGRPRRAPIRRLPLGRGILGRRARETSGGDRAVMSAVFGNSARAHDPTPAPGERGR